MIFQKIKKLVGSALRQINKEVKKLSGEQTSDWELDLNSETDKNSIAC